MASVLSSPSVTIPTMDCTNCKRQGAKLVCSTCGTFYCNVPCQVKHWPRHRNVCMPRLVLATPLVGTAVYIEQNVSSAMSKTLNLESKSCNNESNPANTTSNSNNVIPKPPNGTRRNSTEIKNKQNNLQHIDKKNTQMDTKKPQQKIETVVNKVNDINAKMSSCTIASSKGIRQKIDQKNVAASTENQKPEMASSNTVPPIAKLDNIDQKIVVPSMEKQMPNKLSTTTTTAPPKGNAENVSLKPVHSTTENQESAESVVRRANDTNTKMVNVQRSNLSALKASGTKSDSTTNSQHLQQAPFPEPGSKVMITYVADDKMYIYETGHGPNGEPNGFELLIARSLECSRNVQSYISVPPSVGDIVFAAYDGDYFRAVVKSISNATVDVFFPDFGNFQTVQWNTLKEIPDPKIKYANCLTYAVWIQNVPSFTLSMKKFLNQLVDATEFMLHTVIDMQDSFVKMVEMYQCSEKYYLSTMLQNFNIQAVPSDRNLPLLPKSPPNTAKYVITNPNTYKPVYLEELIDVETIEGKGIELVITDVSENQVIVMTPSNYTLYKTMLKDCDVYGRIDPNPYKPKETEVCLIKREGIWHRAITLNASDDESAMFYLLDEALCIGDDNLEIRRYPPGLTRQQFIVECVLENPKVLLDAMGGCEKYADTLNGNLIIIADVHHSPADEDACETTHLSIVSICKKEL